MSKIRLHIFVVLMMCTQVGWSQTRALMEKIKYQYTEQYSFLSRVYNSPLQFAQVYRDSYSISDISYTTCGAETPIVQAKGKGQQSGQFTSEGLAYISEDLSMWGKAGYSNATTQQVVFNETSDYDYLYPYLITDTLGGSLHTEEYVFVGAVNQRIRTFNLAASFSFRGQLEYRELDPRPLNKVNDISVGVGVSRKILSSHFLGLDFTFGKYKQKNTVKFLKNIGAIPVYHMVGLGHNSYRFYGDKREAFYDGYNTSLTLRFIPNDEQGWNSFLSISQDQITKMLPDMNNLPLNVLNKYGFQYGLGYLYGDKQRAKGVDLNVIVNRSNGIENIFAGAGQNSYEKLDERATFQHHHWLLRLSGFYEIKKEEGWGHSLASHISYEQDGEDYLPLERQKSRNFWLGAVTYKAIKRQQKNVFHLSTGLSYRGLLKSVLQMEDMEVDNMYFAMLHQDFAGYSSPYIQYGLQPTWDRQITSRYVIGIHAKMEATHYIDPSNRMWYAQAGVTLKL